MTTPEDKREAQLAGAVQAIKACQQDRRTPLYAARIGLQAGWVVDRYRALREAGMDRLDALAIAGQAFLG